MIEAMVFEIRTTIIVLRHRNLGSRGCRVSCRLAENGSSASKAAGHKLPSAVRDGGNRK